MPEEKRIDLESLEQRARAASPGPWVVHSDGMEFGSSDRSTNPGVDTADGQVVCWWGTGLCGIPQNPDAEFITSANPEVVLSLIAEVRALRADAERYRWLRDPDGQEDLGSEYNMPPIICGYAEHEDILANDALDRAIDLGMEALKP
ncbi:hypothetical protein QVM48_22215 [Pseudomonas soli]|uniref:hypothetical protein n=1 Tax=Pseudomonas soli TaxID=1306993 RepID=UPI002894D5C3|nr:hypothetical protein [Pseudomonas soli]MDT3716273.1 hypothetical protein [Pseudomonas soli]MDT3732031.1 hypothetical protein [Pseudomonas soli]